MTFPRLLSILLLLLATTQILAAEERSPLDRLAGCETDACTFRQSNAELASAAWQFLGLRLDANWVARNRAPIDAELKPHCAVYDRCLTIPGNPFTLCSDLLSLEGAPACDRLFSATEQPRDWEQCRIFTRIWATAVDQRSMNKWKQAQACAIARVGERLPVKGLRWHLEPASLRFFHEAELRLSVFDEESGLPIHSLIEVEGVPFIRSDAVSGQALAFYNVEFRLLPIREIGPDGLESYRKPRVTVTPIAGEPFELELDAALPELQVSMKPVGRLNRRASVVFEVRDANSGELVEAQIIRGNDPIGRAGERIRLQLSDEELQNGCVQQIWVRASRYPDTRMPCS
jgi:hypothetical protein